MTADAAIVGVGQYGYESEMDEPYVELANEAATRALDDAGLAMDEVDAVVVSHAPEAFIGVAHPERWVADHVGASGRPAMRVHTGGATGGSAAQAGHYHVASGRFETVLVVGAEKVRETRSPQTVLNAIWDPVTEKPFGLNAINMTAFQAVRYMETYGATREDFARVAVRSRENGLHNEHAQVAGRVDRQDVLEAPTLCWPLGLLDSCPSSAGGCAVVVAGEDTVEREALDPAWITGVGARADTYFMGDRMGDVEHDHADWDLLDHAAADGYEMAGIEDPADVVDVAELYAPFTSTEFAAVEAVGFCERGGAPAANRAGRFAVDGDLPVNPSGGTLCANPIAVTALVRVAEAARQVRGTAGDHQVDGVETALATGIGGSLQYHTAMTLESRPERQP